MRIDELLKTKKTFSFEVFPPKKDNPGDKEKLFSTIDSLKKYNPDFISVTYGAGGSTSKNTLEIASYIKNNAKIEALAHLTGGPSSKEDILFLCDEFKKHNIENIMSLRGDYPLEFNESFCKTFPHASDLNNFIKEKYDVAFCLGGACYPEGHIECDNLYEDLINLKKKQDSGASFFITQVFYDNAYYYRLLREARKIGINIPIIAGIMPLTTLSQINKTIKLTGSSIPLSLRIMIEKYKLDKEVIRQIGINYAVSQIIDLLANDVEGIHLYIMNNPLNAEEIYNRIDKIIKKETKLK